MLSVSFCIITDGNRPAELDALMVSIRKQGHDCEIVICGNLRYIRCPDGVRYIPELDGARNGVLGLMRNKAVRGASGDVVVVCDDDILFSPDFLNEVLKVYPFDILCTRIENPDGSRYWDWATYGGAKGHVLLDYGEVDDNVYVTGGLCVARRDVLLDIGWSEVLKINQIEDGEFSSRVKVAGYGIGLCASAIAVHDDPRLTSEGSNHIILIENKLKDDNE